jgi:hypothetical protein
MEALLVGQVRHEDNVVEPLIVEYLPASHDKQVVSAVAAEVGEYLPAMQTVHGPPAGPYEPALHAQALEVEEAAREEVRGGHSLQAVSVNLYFPATHSLQVSPPAPDDEI